MVIGLKSDVYTINDGNELFGHNCTAMEEYIITAAGWCDVTEPPTVIEPLYCTCLHDGYLA